MKSNKINLIMIFSLVLLVVNISNASIDNKTIDEQSLVKKITTTSDPKELRTYYDELVNKYEITKQSLLENLDIAKSKFRDDNSYFSPLHIAILAIGSWQINSAEDSLLSIIDYSINPSTLPDGINIIGDSFYPATRVLVKLRIDSMKIIDSLAKTKHETPLKLLTWVLNERLGDNLEKTILLLISSLNDYKDSKEKNNLNNAVNLLKSIKSSSDLIPSPYIVQKK